MKKEKEWIKSEKKKNKEKSYQVHHNVMSIFSCLRISYFSAKKEKVVFTMYSTPSWASGKEVRKNWCQKNEFCGFWNSFQYPSSTTFFIANVVQEIYIIRVPMYLGLPMACWCLCASFCIRCFVRCREGNTIYLVRTCMPSIYQLHIYVK